MTAAPISRDMAVARLKKALPDPSRRIEFADLIDDAVKTITGGAARQISSTGTPYTDSVLACRADSDVLLHLLAHGVFHDNGAHRDLWRRTRERLVRIRGRIPGGPYDSRLEALRHYPALLATWTMGVAAIVAGREEHLGELLTEPAWTYSLGNARPQTPADYLNPRRVLQQGEALHDIVQAPNGQRWMLPQAKLLREHVREPLFDIEPDDDAYAAACDRFELLASLVSFATAANRVGDPWVGDSLSDHHWESPNGLAAQVSGEITPGWPLIQSSAFGGSADHAKSSWDALAEWRKANYRGW